MLLPRSPLLRNALLCGALTALLATNATSAARYEAAAPIKRLQAMKLAEEPMEHREVRAERARELRRLARELRRSGKSALRVRGQKAKRAGVDDVRAGAPGVTPSGASAAGEVAPVNVRVNGIAGDAASDGQSETSIVAWKQYMMAAWNDGNGWTNGSNQSQGWAISVDGGGSWVDQGTFPLPSDRPNWTWTSDPVLAVNPATGTFYFSALADPDGGFGNTNGIGVGRGRFSGSSFAWENPTLVRSVLYTDSDFLDKQWIAVDPASGRVYISYTYFKAGASEIDFQAADSTLASWTTAKRLSVQSGTASLDESGYVQGSRPVVLSNGSVVVMYYRIGLVDVDYFRVVRSTDHGATFSAPNDAVSFFANFGTGAPGFNRPMGIQFASIAADRSGGAHDGRLLLTWAESYNWYDDEAAAGTGGNRSEVEPNNAGASATPATRGVTLRGSLLSNVDEDWFAIPLTAGDHMLVKADSVASGLTISMRVIGPDAATRLAYTTAGPFDISGGFGPVYTFTAPTTATYYVRIVPSVGTGSYRVRTGAGTRGSERGRDQRDVFSAWSDNAGVTWSTPVRVSDSPVGFDDWLPEAAIAPDGIAATEWFDFRNAPAGSGGGVSHTYLSRSSDGGDTWTPFGALSSAQSGWSTVSSNIQPNQGDYNALFAYDRGLFGCWGDGRDGNPNVYMAGILAAVRADVVSATGSATQANLDWLITEGAPVPSVHVYRRAVPATTWVLLGTVVPDGSHHVVYADTTADAGNTYEYRLGIMDGSVERFYGLATVVMPGAGAGTSIQLSGIFPNPVDGNSPVASHATFRLGAPGAVHAELLDMAGRLVQSWDFGTLAAGLHDVAFTLGSRVRPGIYMLHLTQGGAEDSKRITILR